MPLVSVFRALLVLHLLLNVVAGSVSAIQDSDDAFDEIFELSMSIYMFVFFVVAFVSTLLISIIGLYTFRLWSRPMAIVVTIAGLIITTLMPNMTITGWAAMIDGFGAICWGAALSLAYASELRTRFV